MDKPIISFIIPVYNGEKYLAQSLNSILFQEIQSFEIIVINDGSTDGSLNIITQYADKYKCIHYISIENSGVSAARNKGIDAAAGDYLAFLDADDVLCSKALCPRLIDIIKNEKPDLISMECFFGISSLKKGKKQSLNTSGLVLNDSKDFLNNMRNHFSSYLYRTSLIKREKICFPEGIKISEDRAFLYHVAAAAENVYLFQNTWFIYRIHGDSVMHKNKGFNYLINGNIKAWWYLRDKRDEQFKLSCDSHVFSYMMEYIELSAKHGVPLKEIVETAENSSEYKQALQSYDLFWKSRHSAEVYQSFCESPDAFYNSLRSERIKNTLMSPIRSNRIIKDIYLQITYKDNLSEYTQHIPL